MRSGWCWHAVKLWTLRPRHTRGSTPLWRWAAKTVLKGGRSRRSRQAACGRRTQKCQSTFKFVRGSTLLTSWHRICPVNCEDSWTSAKPTSCYLLSERMNSCMLTFWIPSKGVLWIISRSKLSHRNLARLATESRRISAKLRECGKNLLSAFRSFWRRFARRRDSTPTSCEKLLSSHWDITQIKAQLYVWACAL